MGKCPPRTASVQVSLFQGAPLAFAHFTTCMVGGGVVIDGVGREVEGHATSRLVMMMLPVLLLMASGGRCDRCWFLCLAQRVLYKHTYISVELSA